MYEASIRTSDICPYFSHPLPHSLPCSLPHSVPCPPPYPCQAKVVRSKDRVGTSGKLRSRGFGFLEFSEHSDALQAVRRLNNNPTLFAPTKRPIVQFAWVDATVIRNIVRRREQSKLRQDRLQRASVEEKRAGHVAAKVFELIYVAESTHTIVQSTSTTCKVSASCACFFWWV